jgi:hypothetical protein
MTYATVAELVRQFRERNGTVMCTGLIGYNLSDPVQLARAREKGLFRTVCRKYVQDAVEIAEGLI